MTDLQTLLDDHQMFHSNYQMDYFITARAGGTAYGQYKQALRELVKRHRGLRALDLELAEAELELEDAKALPDETDRDGRVRAIALAKARTKLEDTERTRYDTEREYKRFMAQAICLKHKIGVLTPERRAELDRDMWQFQVKYMAAIDYMSVGRLQSKTIELLQCMPPADRAEVMAHILATPEDEHRPQRLIDWFMSYEHETKMLPEGTDNDA